MDWPTIALIAMLLAGFIAVTVQRDRARRQLAELREASGPRLMTMSEARARMSPEDYPPGTIPADLAAAIREAWRAEGYLTDERTAARLASITHRVIVTHVPGDRPVFNDGDRMPPARVNCQGGAWRCTFPDCGCVAVDPPPPPIPEPPNKPHKGRKAHKP